MKHTLPALGILICLLAAAVPAVNAQIGGNEGWITIQCNVNGASVYFNGQYQGIISGNQLTVPVYTTGTPYTSYSVEKTGYYSATGSMIMPAAGETRTYTATLQPMPTPEPSYGSVFVGSSPAGASVSMNGYYRGTTPLTINSVSPGTYPVSIDLSGYYPYQTTTTVTAGSTSTVYGSLTLIPAPTTGYIYVSSTPSGATVYLDGTNVGQTPASGSLKLNTAAGSHSVSLQLAGYQPYTAGVSVATNAVSQVSAVLTPVNPSPVVGGLSVSSTPAGADVYLDNIYQGITPIALNNVAAGTHNLLVQMTGYNDYAVSVQVNAGATNTVAAVLSPVATPTKKSGMLPYGAGAAVGLAGLLVMIRRE